jgi:hypothetical protein
VITHEWSHVGVTPCRLVERGTEIWIERRKWPDIPHYGHEGWALGEDEHGFWMELRPGRPVHRGDEVLFIGQWAGLMLSPPHGRTLIWFPQGGDIDLYVDIGCDTVRTDTSLVIIDLDLDVVRHRPTGVAELIDEDEFAEHQVTYGYSASMIEQAAADGADVLRAVQANEPPFDGVAAARWMARATSGGGTTSAS